jgi:hypothetical protein
MNDDEHVEYALVRDATLWDFEVISNQIASTPSNEGPAVHIEMKVEEEGLDHYAIPLIFALSVLSFHDARPRGASGHWYEDDDQFSAADLLRHLRYEEGELRLYVDYLRGRCVKTDIKCGSDGRVTLNTVNRGEAATRWVDTLRGKKHLRPVPTEGAPA